MKYFKTISILAVIVIALTIITNGCKVPQSIADKTGEDLWGENCNRCHNSQDPLTYSDDQWEAAMEHMRQKAFLTDEEVMKIRDFLRRTKQ